MLSATTLLFTIGRTLAVLITNIPGFSTEHQYTLPSAQSDSVFAKQESLDRFLLKATATAADDRFQTAEEMAEQLLGVLREVVAAETNTPRPATSILFDGDRLAVTAGGDFSPIKPSYLHLPHLLIDIKDPGFNVILNASMTTDLDRRIEQLTQVVKQLPTSIEAKLKLAFAIAAEQGSNYTLAAQMYELVERTDLNYPTAAFGLARCRLMQGDRNAAVTALQQVPPTSNLYTRAKVEIARILVDRQLPVAINIPQHPAPTLTELKSATQTVESLTLEGIERYRLDRQVLETALTLLTSKAITAQNNLMILGQPLEEIKLREGLEKVLRSIAHLSTGSEKIMLVDEANRVRPKTLF